MASRHPRHLPPRLSPSSAMNARLLLLWLLAMLVITGPGASSVAANGRSPGVAGRYSDGGNPPTYIDLRADGTFTVTQGSNAMQGTYTAQGNNLTVTMAGRPAPFQLANGILTSPDGMQLRRVGEPVAAAAGAQSGANPQGAGAVDQLALVKSIGNVKQLCMACKLWAADHQGAFPDTLDQLMNPEYPKIPVPRSCIARCSTMTAKPATFILARAKRTRRPREPSSSSAVGRMPRVTASSGTRTLRLPWNFRGSMTFQPPCGPGRLRPRILPLQAERQRQLLWRRVRRRPGVRGMHRCSPRIPRATRSCSPLPTSSPRQ